MRMTQLTMRTNNKMKYAQFKKTKTVKGSMDNSGGNNSKGFQADVSAPKKAAKGRLAKAIVKSK